VCPVINIERKLRLVTYGANLRCRRRGGIGVWSIPSASRTRQRDPRLSSLSNALGPLPKFHRLDEQRTAMQLQTAADYNNRIAGRSRFQTRHPFGDRTGSRALPAKKAFGLVKDPFKKSERKMVSRNKLQRQGGQTRNSPAGARSVVTQRLSGLHRLPTRDRQKKAAGFAMHAGAESGFAE